MVSLVTMDSITEQGGAVKSFREYILRGSLVPRKANNRYVSGVDRDGENAAYTSRAECLRPGDQSVTICHQFAPCDSQHTDVLKLS